MCAVWVGWVWSQAEELEDMVKCVHLGTCTCKSPEAGTVSSRVVWNTRETSIGPARGTVELWNILVREGRMFS